MSIYCFSHHLSHVYLLDFITPKFFTPTHLLSLYLGILLPFKGVVVTYYTQHLLIRRAYYIDNTTQTLSSTLLL